jgi:hypothetical protein
LKAIRNEKHVKLQACDEASGTAKRHEQDRELCNGWFGRSRSFRAWKLALQRKKITKCLKIVKYA